MFGSNPCQPDDPAGGFEIWVYHWNNWGATGEKFPTYAEAKQRGGQFWDSIYEWEIRATNAIRG